MVPRFATRGFRLSAAVLLAILLAESAWAQLPAPQAPVPPQAPASPAQTDPRIPQVRAAVERQGQRVLEVAATRHREGYRIWIVYTTASYAQPSVAKVVADASSVWWATWGVVSTDPPDTDMVSAQVWSKYVIGMSVTNQVYSTFLSAYRAATTDAQRSAAFDELLKKSYINIFDLEARQGVDTKDFINKNFTR
jgi:hypothetical protein